MSKAVSTGVEDFKKLIDSNYYFVDKTLFIKNVIDNADNVCLITRPRRFGKTLNLSMLKYYFDIKEDSKELFKGLKIMDTGERYTSEMNKHPVILFSLKDIKDIEFKDSLITFNYLIAELFNDYKFLLDSNVISKSEKSFIKRAINNELKYSEMSLILKVLSNCLYKYYNKKVIMLIDEYDVPLQEAYVNGYYNKAIKFWMKFFNASFKSNLKLHKTILTGVSKIVKESIFTGTNNFKTFSILSDNEFSACFGFTGNEVETMLKSNNLLEYKEDVKTWYDGYKIGNSSNIYNPWSVLNFVQDKKFMTYWVNTSGNEIIRSILKQSLTIKKELEKLLNGETIKVWLDDNVILTSIFENENNVWNLLISSGYLRVIEELEYGYAMVELPNLEIRKLFEKIIVEWFVNVSEQRDLTSLVEYLISLDYQNFVKQFKELIYEMFSTWDVSKNTSENFYHAFVLGLLVSLKDTYYITSNRESGKGRYDILMKPKDKGMPSFILEFKVVNNDNFKNIIDGAKNQVMTQEYDTILRQEGYENIQKLVFAFQGKDVEIEVF